MPMRARTNEFTRMRDRLLVFNPVGRRYYPQAEVVSLLKRYQSVFVLRDREYSDSLRMPSPVLFAKYLGPPGMLGIDAGKLSLLRRMSEITGMVAPSAAMSYEIFSFLTFQVEKAKRDFRFKHIVTCDETATMADSTWARIPPIRLFAKFVAKNADMFIAHTEKARDSLLSAGADAEKTVQIYPGIFIKDYLDLAREAGGEVFSVLYVGPLRPNKGIITLLSAFCSISESEIGPCRLTIAGKGPLEQSVREFAAGDKRINFEGYVSESRKRLLLSAADLFIYPSEDTTVLGSRRWEEQTAIGAVEAMGAGVPVIGSDSGSLPEMLRRSDVIFRQGSAPALKAKILELHSDAGRRRELSLFNRQLAARDYDIEKYAGKLNAALSSFFPTEHP